jgi:hypothetical protein
MQNSIPERIHPRIASHPMWLGLLGLCTCLLAACTSRAIELTPDEQTLVASIGMESGIAREVKRHGVSLSRLKGVTPDYDEVIANGIVLETEPNSGRTALEKVRERLKGTPFDAYLYDESFGYGADKVAIVDADDEAYLAIVRTDGVNHDLDHDEVMARYRQWDEKYGLKLVGAGQSWIEAQLTTPPTDWLALAQEVYEFCPDVVDQGAGDVATLAAEMKQRNFIYLWWD